MAEIITPLSSEPVIHWKKPVILTALLVFAFYASTHMVAAGDTWVALTCGRHFANHGVDTVEPFSFNSHPAGPSEEQLAAWPQWMHGMIRFWHPTGWINQNWLAHLGFYKLVTLGTGEGEYNYNMLVYWKFGLFAATIFVVFAIGKLLGAGDFWSTAAACFAMVVGRSFYDIRPACYSNLLVPAFILLLALSTYKHYKYIWMMIPLIIFWANVHGGYIYAYMMLTPFAAIHILLNVPRRWTVAVGLSGLWMVMYLLYYKFHTNPYHLEFMRHLNPEHIKPGFANGILYTGILLACISLLLAGLQRIPTGLFYSYHVIASLMYLMLLLVKFSVVIPANINPLYRRILDHFQVSSITGFFILVIFGGAIIILTAIRKERFVRISNKTLIHIMAAATVSFLAMILFNPFHLTNLTHTFEISISEHAASWRSVNEWRPAFDWMDPTTDKANPVGDEEAFAVMCVIGAAAFVVWVIFQFLKPVLRPQRKGPRQATSGEDFSNAGAVPSWPKIDAAMILVGTLTIYMAIQSRRFIALAGPSACPMLGMIICQIWGMFSVRRNRQKTLNLEPIVPSAAFHRYTWGGTIVLLVILGSHWGWTYYRIYLKPWPVDDTHNSVFMRMTASNQKPFEVCDFINDNKLTGRIFNYWTEGGGLAFGQKPDPKTGRTPLQHFMDGRAQAAFNHDMFKLWQYIYAGGPIAEQAARAGKSLSAEDHKKIGQWLDSEFRDRQVWCALIPKNESDKTFMRSLLSNSNWKTAYIDEMQHLVVNIESEQGQRLIHDILEGRAIFPNEFSKNMTLCRLVFETNAPGYVSQVFNYANAAFKARQYPSAMLALIQVSRVSTFQNDANKVITDYLEFFKTNRETLAKESGYLQRLASAMLAARHLAYVEPHRKDEQMRMADALEQESKDISKRFVW
jgi:hypothetical protein